MGTHSPFENLKGSEIHEKFEFLTLLDSGRYSNVHIVRHRGNKQIFAAKVFISSTLKALQMWANEEKVLRFLQKHPNYPQIFWAGCITEQPVIIMKALGPDLRSLLTFCGGKFSIKTTIKLGVQMLSLLEVLHQADIVYRDVKPQNFVMGEAGSNATKLHLIDFGLCSRVKSAVNKRTTICGTLCYVSINTHDYFYPSFRDDVESVIYVLVFFVKGTLPWMNIGAHFERIHLIGEKKKSSSQAELFHDLHCNWFKAFEHVRSLEYAQKPDYNYLRSLLEEILNEEFDSVACIL